MFKNQLAARHRPFRRATVALVTASVALTGVMTGLLASPASAADPTPPAGMSTVASIAGSSQTNVPNSGPLTALQNGTTVSVTMTASGASAGKFFGADVRLCAGGANIVFQSDFNPTQGGNCIDQPFNAQSDSVVTASAAPNNVTATANFRVGTGSRTFTASGAPVTITCDATHPCSLWIKESFDTALVASGSQFLHYDITYAGTPAAPAVTAAGGNTTGTVTWTAPANTGNAPITSYTVSLSPPDAAAQTVSGATTTANFTGLTNFTTYTASVTASNTAVDGTTHFVSPAGTATFSPAPAAPTNLQATAANQSALLSWTAPAGPAPTNYSVVIHQVNPAGADIGPTLTGSTTPSYNATGLTNGTVYTFQVTAVYGASNGAQSATSAPFTPQGKFITQTITVTRPQGALVLTQICGNHSARAADPAIPNWWPGSPAVAVVSNGTAPNAAGAPDPLFGQYPNPVDASGNPTATYPTDCAVNLGTARFITSGPGAGQFFQAKGLLSQVTIVDTRDTDPGWVATGTMGTFTNAAGKTFGGGQLGWTPIKTSTTPSFTDASGNSYVQTASAGAVVAPNTGGAAGMGSGQPLGTAAAAVTTGTSTTGGLGIAVFDADLNLRIPVFAKSGTYNGTLTISAA